MRLSQQTEWIVIGVLILYIAFMPSLPVVGTLVGSPVGKAIALAGVVYAWKYISAPIALLLLVSVLRTGEIRERFTGNCPAGYSPDETSKLCKNNTGQTIPPVICMSSQKWDQESGSCKSAEESKPSPKPVEMEMPTPPPGFTPNEDGPGAGGPPGGTTGAAAAQMAMSATPSSMPPSSGGVSATSGKTTSSTSAPVGQ